MPAWKFTTALGEIMSLDFTYEPDAANNLIIDFTAVKVGTFDSFAWTFGDSGTSQTESPSHEYASEGIYTVTLTATASDLDDPAVISKTIIVGIDFLGLTAGGKYRTQRFASIVTELLGNLNAGWVVAALNAVNYSVASPDVDSHLAGIDAALGTMTESLEGIIPAASVEEETDYGLTPSVGTETYYARADHTHGTPDAIVPGYLYGTTDPPSPTGLAEGTIYLKYTE